MTTKHVEITGVQTIRCSTVRHYNAVVGVIEYVLRDGSTVKVALESDEAIHANARIANKLAANAIEGAEDFRDLGLNE